MKERTSIIVADDHPIVREGIVALLSRKPHLHVIGVAESFLDLWNVLQSNGVDIVVLDIGNMGAPAIETAISLRRSYPNMSIIVFSSSVELAPELLHVGIRGYVIKEELSQHLLTAVATVQDGETFLSPLVSDYLERCQAQPGQERLTPQELNVIRLLHLGLSTREMAHSLELDEGTIYNYVMKLKQKTGCPSRKHLIEWYRQVHAP